MRLRVVIVESALPPESLSREISDKAQKAAFAHVFFCVFKIHPYIQCLPLTEKKYVVCGACVCDHELTKY